MSETSEDEFKAIGEAVSATVASMHENADPAVRAALEDHERDKDDLCRKLEAATINGTAARNGLALAAVREKNLRAECERLKAELEREREECERLKSLVTDMGGDPRRPEPMPLMENEAGQVPCCSVCGGLGGTLKDADAPVPAHLPPCSSPSEPYFGPACAGSGQPAAWGAHEQPWARATLIRSDKPAEPVAGDAANLSEPQGYPVSDMLLGCRPKSEAEKRIEALEKRLADVECRFVTRLDRLSEWQSRDAKAAADAIEALERQGLDARLAGLRREFDDHVQQCLGRDADLRQRGEAMEVWLKALTDRVQALECGPKAETGKAYRAATAAISHPGPVLQSWTRDRHEAEDRLLRLREFCAGLRMPPPDCWLEVSDDNGRTWKRCEE